MHRRPFPVCVGLLVRTHTENYETTNDDGSNHDARTKRPTHSSNGAHTHKSTVQITTLAPSYTHNHSDGSILDERQAHDTAEMGFVLLQNLGKRDLD